MTDPIPSVPVPAPDIEGALKYLGGLCDTALDTMKPGVRPVVLGAAQEAINLLAKEIGKVAPLTATIAELHAKIAALEVVANAPRAIPFPAPDGPINNG